MLIFPVPAADDPATATTTDPTTTTEPTGSTPTWATWTRQPERQFRGQVFEGPSWLASDPCVLADGDTYRIYYTCLAGAEVGGLCGVSSPDGFAWTPVASIDPNIEGLVVRARPGVGWDENMETCAVRRGGERIELHYAGYPQVDMNGDRGPSALGRLVSADGVHFERDPDAPVLTATPGGRDGDDIFSPMIVNHDGTLELVHVGYCVDGYHDGVAEPDLLRGPDGRYYLFMTGGLGDDEPRITGLAVGPTALGPWTLDPDPIVEGEPRSFDACGAFAPSVVFAGDRVRMWYLGVDDCGGACPSCDLTQCGCDPHYSIGYAEAAWPLYLE